MQNSYISSEKCVNKLLSNVLNMLLFRLKYEIKIILWKTYLHAYFNVWIAVTGKDFIKYVNKIIYKLK